MKKKILGFIRRLIGTETINKKMETIINSQLFRGTIENSGWLKYKSFAPGGWAMDNAALYTLFRILNNMKPKNILEFGLGQSSKMLHQYATFTENVNALTIEHDNDWIQFLCNEIPKEIKINIKQYEKELVLFNGYETLSYKNINDLNDEYDLVIVDGPFGSEHYSRSQSIEIVRNNNIGKSFCIFFDDSQRNGEKETIEMVCKILMEKSIKYHKRDYNGEKGWHTIICSDDLKFLMSL